MDPTQEQIDHYTRHGFLPWGRVLEDGLLSELRAEYDRQFAHQAVTDLVDGALGQRNLQIVQLCERSLPFRRLLHHPAILTVFRALLGPQLMLFHDQALWKPARCGAETPWHQDNGYWRCRPANLASCWIALDDADAANGAMQFAPGSQLAAVDHGADGRRLLRTAEPDPDSVVTVPLPAGACLFHHCQTLHRTAPNRTDRDRRAFIIHVMVPGTCDRDGRILAPGWEHPAL